MKFLPLRGTLMLTYTYPEYGRDCPSAHSTFRRLPMSCSSRSATFCSKKVWLIVDTDEPVSSNALVEMPSICTLASLTFPTKSPVLRPSSKVCLKFWGLVPWPCECPSAQVRSKNPVAEDGQCAFCNLSSRHPFLHI